MPCPLPGARIDRVTYGLDCPQGRLLACVGVHDPPEGRYTAATGLPFPRPIPSLDRFTDTWKELVKPLALDRPVSVADPPTDGRFWPLQPWARYIQSRPPLVETIDWKRPLTFLLPGDAYPCAGGSWTQLSIGLLNHGARGWIRLGMGDWYGRLRGQGHGRASDNMVQEHAGIRSSCFAFVLAVISRGYYLTFRKN